MKKFLLSFLISVSACVAANTCTAYTYPAMGTYPAINGVWNVSWGSAQIIWSASFSPSAPTQSQVVYATLAQWSANPGVYPQSQGNGSIPTQPGAPSNTSTPQTLNVSNLLPNTTYHAMGQSYQGGAWCTGQDVTFTTLARPSGQFVPQKPTLAIIPSINPTGTFWVVGTNCGTGQPTPQASLQSCLNGAHPGDDIALPQGTTYPLTSSLTVPLSTFDLTANCTLSLCTGTVSQPANGTRIITTNGPTPIYPGGIYTVVNSTGSGFQLSLDGTNAIPFTALPSGSMYYKVYPITQLPIYIHTQLTNPNQFPPPGTSINAGNLAEYWPNLAKLQMMDPFSQSPFYFQQTTGSLYIYDLGLTVDGNVALSQSGNVVDPMGWRNVWAMSPQTRNVVLDRFAFHTPALPTRTLLMNWGGGDNSIVNSCVACGDHGLDWWEPTVILDANKDLITNTGTGTLTLPASKITFPAVNYYWPGLDGTSATLKHCVVPSSSITLTGGTGTGNYAIWVDPTTCFWSIQLPLTVANTYTFTGNLQISAAATPTVPTVTYTSPNLATQQLWNALIWGDVSGTGTQGSITGSQFTSLSQGDPPHSTLATEGGDGIYIGNGGGPWAFLNNDIHGTDIMGVFIADDGITGQGCAAGPCLRPYRSSNMIHQRGTVTTNLCNFIFNPCWNGNNANWRNMDESKIGDLIWIDGVKFGPIIAQLGNGEAFSAYNYGTGSIDGNGPSYQDASDITFSNNSVVAASFGEFGPYHYMFQQPAPQKRVWIHNNVLNLSGFTWSIGTSPIGVPMGTGHQQSNQANSCTYGFILGWADNGEDWGFDHNTVYHHDGCQPYILWNYNSLSSGIQYTNNIIDVPGNTLGASPPPVSLTTYLGNNGPNDTPNCNTSLTGTQGNALFACNNLFTWSNNLLVPGFADTQSSTDYTSGQITTLQGLLPGNTLWASGATAAARLSSVGFWNPSNNLFRLTLQSTYKNKATDSTDLGIDQNSLDVAQGNVFNVHTSAETSTSFKVSWLAPDSFACGVDYATSDFSTGSVIPTRVSSTSASFNPRSQSATISGIAAHSNVWYRVNCAVQQPYNSVQLP